MTLISIMITLYGFLCSHLTQTVILWNACRRWSSQLFAISNLSKESYFQSLSKRSAAIPNAEQCKDGIRAEALNANLEEKVNRGLRCKTDRQKRGCHLCARPNFEMSNQAGQCCNSLYDDTSRRLTERRSLQNILLCLLWMGKCVMYKIAKQDPP